LPTVNHGVEKKTQSSTRQAEVFYSGTGGDEQWLLVGPLAAKMARTTQMNVAAISAPILQTKITKIYIDDRE